MYFRGVFCHFTELTFFDYCYDRVELGYFMVILGLGFLLGYRQFSSFVIFQSRPDPSVS